MNRKEKGYLLLGFGAAWAVSRVFALIRGDAVSAAVTGLVIAGLLLVYGLICAKDFEFALVPKSQNKEGYEHMLEKYD
jgi:hypothetical protein